MYALTVRQPWAWAIIHAHKDVENRTWPTEYRGSLAIHAGRTYDDRAAELFAPGRGKYAHIQLPDELLYGAIIGTVDVVDCVFNSQSQWAVRGQYHWLLANPRPLATPVPLRGQQGLWTPTYDTLRRMVRQNADLGGN